ncbi:MAG: hypothetical protein KC519_11195 [Anaerolineae bacterium]|nr:hypothetical protein [Anaerolineae bacterium]
MTYQQIEQAAEELTEAGWTFSPDATTWTGGFWWHEELGFVTNQGGPFKRYAEATEAAITMIENLARCQ